MTPSEPRLDKHIDQELFKRYANGDIKVVTTINQGVSGATVYLVKIAGKSDQHYSGLAFAKIDSQERCEREYRKHASAHQGKISAYLPAIVCEPIGPVEKKSLNLYQVAQNTTYHTRLLSHIVSEHSPRKQITDQLSRLLNTVLACWHNVDQMINYSETHAIPNLFNELINIGQKKRIDQLEQRTQNYFGITRHNEVLMFRPGNIILPNPVAYILNPALWENAMPVVVPRSATHGDLHGGNIICRIGNNGAGADPWLIDLAQFEEESLPFFDLAYLELDMILSSMPVTNEESWKNWLHLTKHLGSAVLPEDDPSGDRAFYAWQIIRPIREYLSQLLKTVGSKSKNLDEHFEVAWWVSAVAAGVLTGRRSRLLRHGDRMAALLYAAYAQQRLNDMFQFPPSSQKPADIEFNPAVAHTNGHVSPVEAIMPAILVQSTPLPQNQAAVAIPLPDVTEYPEYYVGFDFTDDNRYEFKVMFNSVFTNFQPFYADSATEEKSRLIRKWQRISLAKFCLFDVASHNADTLMELGIALSRNRPIILIKRADAVPAIPLPDDNVITYTTSSDLKIQLSQLVEKGFPFKAPAKHFCHFCKRVCDAFSTPPKDNVGLALNNSKLLWHRLNQRLAPYLSTRHIQQINLTDVPIQTDLCEVRGMVLSCEFAIAHLGTLSNDNTYFSLGAVMGVPNPWLILRTRPDPVPSNLQGIDMTLYTDPDKLGVEKDREINSFLDSVSTPLEEALSHTQVIPTAPIWQELKKSLDRTRSVIRTDEDARGRLQIVWYEDERFRSKHLIFPEGLIFGREADKCNVPLLHRNVSSQHFRVFQDRNDKYYIEDMSKNGVQLNGVRLLANKKTEIAFKDMIRIDGTRFNLLIWDESNLPETARQEMPQTMSLRTPILEIVIPDIKPPETSGKIDYRCILEVCPPSETRSLKLEVQSFYPMGRILAVLAKKLDFRDLKYCFMLKNQQIDEMVTPLHLGLGETDVFNIIVDPWRN